MLQNEEHNTAHQNRTPENDTDSTPTPTTHNTGGPTMNNTASETNTPETPETNTNNTAPEGIIQIQFHIGLQTPHGTYIATKTAHEHILYTLDMFNVNGANITAQGTGVWKGDTERCITVTTIQPDTPETNDNIEGIKQELEERLLQDEVMTTVQTITVL